MNDLTSIYVSGREYEKSKWKNKIKEKIKELEQDMVLPETRQVLKELLEEVE